ncbi:MAG: HU family DNA-binding protein [Bacteroidaceae bacterium]|nr:HU family DNA-binding protein [Bacteroidaceae bacterium]
MINYKVSKCKNPNGIEGVDYFSCKASKTSDYTFKELASDIAYSTTCTKADALAVLSSIKPFVEKALLSGRRVVLEDLGSFVIGIRSKCFSSDAIAAEDFSPSSMIRGYSVRFRPEVELKKDIAKGIAYKRISSEAMK